LTVTEDGLVDTEVSKETTEMPTMELITVMPPKDAFTNIEADPFLPPAVNSNGLFRIPVSEPRPLPLCQVHE
jgi:hypothetical protein